MTALRRKVELRRVCESSEWDAYHVLRETVLWGRRADLPPYDRDHPDEVANGHYPFLFFVDDDPVGTIRVDIEPPIAWFRLVAVREDHQGRGLGRQMLALATDFARDQGCSTLRCNADADAVAFYVKLGFEPIGDSPVELFRAL